MLNEIFNTLLFVLSVFTFGPKAITYGKQQNNSFLNSSQKGGEGNLSAQNLANNAPNNIWTLYPNSFESVETYPKEIAYKFNSQKRQVIPTTEEQLSR